MDYAEMDNIDNTESTTESTTDSIIESTAEEFLQRKLSEKELQLYTSFWAGSGEDRQLNILMEQYASLPSRRYAEEPTDDSEDELRLEVESFFACSSVDASCHPESVFSFSAPQRQAVGHFLGCVKTAPEYDGKGSETLELCQKLSVPFNCSGRPVLGFCSFLSQLSNIPPLIASFSVARRREVDPAAGNKPGVFRIMSSGEYGANFVPAATSLQQFITRSVEEQECVAVNLSGSGWPRYLVRYLLAQDRGIQLENDCVYNEYEKCDENAGTEEKNGPAKAVAGRGLLFIPEKNTASVTVLAKEYGIEIKECGQLTTEKKIRINDNEHTVLDLPLALFREKPTIPDRPLVYPPPLKKKQTNPDISVKDRNRMFLQMSGSTVLGNKAWLFSQFDRFTRGLNVARAGQGHYSLFRLKLLGNVFAATLTTASEYCDLDPWVGTLLSVSEAIRNLTCAGVKPAIISFCLAAPASEHSMVYYKRVKTLEALAEAIERAGLKAGDCRTLQYTDDPEAPVLPVILLGGRAPTKKVPGKNFTESGDLMYLVGESRVELGGSWLSCHLHGENKGYCPRLDLEEELYLGNVMRELVNTDMLHSVYGLGRGGLLAALSEASFSGEMGFILDEDSGVDSCEALWSEGQGRYLVSLNPEQQQAFEQHLENHGVVWRFLGKTGGRMFQAGKSIRMPVRAACDVYRTALRKSLGKDSEEMEKGYESN